MSVLANTNDTYHRFLIAAFESSPKVILPPSAAIAGIYVRVDVDRGVNECDYHTCLQALKKKTNQIDLPDILKGITKLNR